MTKTYALKRLLEHGPLSFGEMFLITGWRRRTVDGALNQLREQGLAIPVNVEGKRAYCLAE